MDANELLKKIRKIEIKTRGLSQNIFAGEYHSAFKGRGVIFSEVREYEPGDDIRDIDWNVTSRHNKPYVKVYEEERELTMMLLVDVSGSRDFGACGEEKKEKIRELLWERGIDLEQMKAEQNMSDVDDFDFICHVAFDKKPLTRRERANYVKTRDFFSKYSGAARQVLEALLDKYMNTGIYEIEKTEILKLDPFQKMGKPAKIAAYFGGKEGYLRAVRELENAIYTDEAG